MNQTTRSFSGPPTQSSTTSVIAVVLALVIAGVVPTVTHAAEMRRGAGQYTPGRYSGVDGYIRQSGINMPNCNGHFVLSWLDVDGSLGSNRAFVQAGQHQGQFFGWPGNCAASDVRMYVEMTDCSPNVPGVLYGKWDVGKQPTPNYPMYISRVNVTSTSPCGGTAYRYAVRVGSFSSSPVNYSDIKGSNGEANAQQEIFWDNGSPDNIGTNRWGLDHAFQHTAGYGMSLYDLSTNTWSGWDSTRTTYPIADPALTRYQPSSWRYTSFTVDD